MTWPVRQHSHAQTFLRHSPAPERRRHPPNPRAPGPHQGGDCHDFHPV